MTASPPNRRPVAMRTAPPIQALARVLARAGVAPNTISILSVVCAATAGIMLLAVDAERPVQTTVLLLGAPAFVGLRGLCNLLDGLVAVEGGRGTRSGELFNELPDRVSDLLLYVCAGYAVTGMGWGSAVGWAAGALAVLTAYVRALGGAMGARQYFIGPMAKTHRMAVLTLGCIAAVAEVWWRQTTIGLAVALAVIGAGCIVTTLIRARLIMRELEGR